MNNTNKSLLDQANETAEMASLVPYGITAGITVNTLLILLIVGGNFLVIVSYATNRRLSTGTYAFLVSLAFSDLLVGGVSIPMRIYGSAKSWNVSKDYIRFYNSFDIFSAIASNLHLMAISFDRFIAVSRPFYYQTLSARPYAFASALSWSLAMLVAALHPGNYFQNADKLIDVYSVLLFSVCFLGPLTVIIIVNIGIFYVAKMLIQRVPSQHLSDQQRLRKERKTAFTLIIMTGCFLIAWFPFFIVNMLFLLCLKCLPSSLEARFFLVDIIKWLQYSNSAVNPVIYAFRDIEMRRTFARLLGPLGRFCRVNQVRPEFNNTRCQISLDTLTRK